MNTQDFSNNPTQLDLYQRLQIADDSEDAWYAAFGKHFRTDAGEEQSKALSNSFRKEQKLFYGVLNAQEKEVMAALLETFMKSAESKFPPTPMPPATNTTLEQLLTETGIEVIEEVIDSVSKTKTYHRYGELRVESEINADFHTAIKHLAGHNDQTRALVCNLVHALREGARENEFSPYKKGAGQPIGTWINKTLAINRSDANIRSHPVKVHVHWNVAYALVSRCGAVLSAADLLWHEMMHSFRRINHPIYFYSSRVTPTPDKRYPEHEEKDLIEGPESELKRLQGQKTRSVHHMGKYLKAASITLSPGNILRADGLEAPFGGVGPHTVTGQIVTASRETMELTIKVTGSEQYVKYALPQIVYFMNKSDQKDSMRQAWQDLQEAKNNIPPDEITITVNNDGQLTVFNSTQAARKTAEMSTSKQAKFHEASDSSGNELPHKSKRQKTDVEQTTMDKTITGSAESTVPSLSMDDEIALGSLNVALNEIEQVKAGDSLFKGPIYKREGMLAIYERNHHLQPNESKYVMLTQKVLQTLDRENEQKRLIGAKPDHAFSINAEHLHSHNTSSNPQHAHRSDAKLRDSSAGATHHPRKK
ncbi:MAG: hypothetical protein V4568_00705 [Pseudomonadota bacterium]